MCVKIDEELGYFDTHLSVARADLEALGFDASNASIEQMREIARQISGSEAVMATWWMAAEYAAEDLGIPKKKQGEKSEW